MSPNSSLLLLSSLILYSCFFLTPTTTKNVANLTATPDPPARRCPTPRRCPAVPTIRRPTPPRYPPRPAPPSLPGPLLPRQPANNPGPLSDRSLILFITRELKRNITSDPRNYTGSWVGNNYCLFRGYYCDTVPDKNITGLAGIDFNGATFGGPNLNFYRYVRFLRDIKFFHVNTNNFSGFVFPGISKLRYFAELDLSNNGFRGGFPVSIIGANRLVFIDVRFNGHNGPVPRQIFDVNTKVLFINSNGFTQTIPSNFGNTPALYITLAKNRFTGPIPRSIGRAWSTLREVLFLQNRLSGCLPYEIGFLNRATVFDVGSNLLTGPIPQSFGCLTSMQLLNLAHNLFYGAIPESLCRLRYGYNFDLSYNYFTQIGPYCRRMVTLGRLKVGRNCIMGFRGQRTAANCAAFFSRPRSCPRQSSFSLVPCTLRASMAATSSFRNATGGGLEEEEELESVNYEVVAPAPSPTYAALVKPSGR